LISAIEFSSASWIPFGETGTAFLTDPINRKSLNQFAWIGKFDQYLQDLEGWIVNVMLRPDLFQTLPWNYYVQCSADECIRRLRLQERALATIQEGEVSSSGSTPDKADLSGFLRRLQTVVDQRGLNYCAGKSGVSRDTIADMLQGRTETPQKKTVQKLEKFVANEPAKRHGRN
jgi:hypothetical protein